MKDRGSLAKVLSPSQFRVQNHSSKLKTTLQGADGPICLGHCAVAAQRLLSVCFRRRAWAGIPRSCRRGMRRLVEFARALRLPLVQPTHSSCRCCPATSSFQPSQQRLSPSPPRRHFKLSTAAAASPSQPLPHALRRLSPCPCPRTGSSPTWPPDRGARHTGIAFHCSS